MDETTVSSVTGSPRYMLNRATMDLCRHPEGRKLVADKAAFFANYPLDDAARQALLEQDYAQLLELGLLPNLVYRLYALHGMKPESFAKVIAGRS